MLINSFPFGLARWKPTISSTMKNETRGAYILKKMILRIIPFQPSWYKFLMLKFLLPHKIKTKEKAIGFTVISCRHRCIQNQSFSLQWCNSSSFPWVLTCFPSSHFNFLKKWQQLFSFNKPVSMGPKTYQLENTSSHTITEVKQSWAWLVLGWETVQVMPEWCC